MIPEAENKMLDPQTQKADDPGHITMKTVGILKNEYHFAGLPHWKPLAVLAATRQEAIELWKKLRKPINDEPPAPESQPAPQTTTENQ